MPASRGFAKAQVMADIPQNLPGGSTAMVEGLYKGWDEIRTVPAGQQSGLRVIVLFTDGASNSVPANWSGSGVSRGCAHRTSRRTSPTRTTDVEQPADSGVLHHAHRQSSGVPATA